MGVRSVGRARAKPRRAGAKTVWRISNHVAAGAAIDDTISRGIDIVRKLDAIVRNRHADYRRHWHEAAQRLLTETKFSCFVTAMYASPADGVIFMWPAYRRGEDIFVQHRLLLPEHIVGDFDSLNPYAQVSAHETESADGAVLFEWQVQLHDVARFVDAT